MCDYVQLVRVLDPVWYLPFLVSLILWFLGRKYSKKWLSVVALIIALSNIIILHFFCALVDGIT